MSQHPSEEIGTVTGSSRSSAETAEESFARQERDQDLRLSEEENAQRTAVCVKQRLFRHLKFRLDSKDEKYKHLQRKVLTHLGWKDATSKHAKECWNNVKKTFAQQVRTKRNTVNNAIKKVVIGEWWRRGF